MAEPSLNDWCHWATALGVPHDEGKDHRVGVLLLAALYVGPQIAPLRFWTSYTDKLVRDTSYYCRRNRIWRGRNMHYPWLDDLFAKDAKATIGFVCDVMVASGKFVRTADEEPRYRIRALGEYITNAPEEWMDVPAPPWILEAK